MFDRLATWFSDQVGRALAFLCAFTLIVIWLIGGIFVGFSDAYQLPINTITTIVTFLLGFLIINTENRNSRALHLKLDALNKAIDTASDEALHAEDLTRKELDDLSESIDPPPV